MIFTPAVLLRRTGPLVLVNSTKTEHSSASSHTVNNPSSIEPRSLLLMCVGLGNTGITVTPPSGWSQVLADAATAIFKKVANGAEGATQSWGLSGSVVAAWVAYQIRNPHGDVEVAAANGFDPPSLSPTWGALNTLWLAGATYASTAGGVVTGYPANYSSGQQDAEVGGTAGCAVATRGVLNASTENPAAGFAGSSNIASRGFTIAVRPLM